MDKKDLIELTNKLYKMTILFPKKEPLRYKMREVADEILANFTSLEALRNLNPGNLADNWERRYKDLVFLAGKDLEILKSYFGVAKWQNWLDYFDVLEIEKEYDKIQSKIEQEIRDFEIITEDVETKEQAEQEALRPLVPLVPIEKSPGFEQKFEQELPKQEAQTTQKKDFLDSRKEKILEILKEKGRAQVWEINKILPEVSKRTLRRDFEKLLKHGLVERVGERSKTFYQLKKEI